MVLMLQHVLDLSVIWISGFFLYVGSGHNRRVTSQNCSFGGLDLIIADLPEGLHVPNVSSPPHIIPL